MEQLSHTLHWEENSSFVVFLPQMLNLNATIWQLVDICCGTVYKMMGLDSSEILMTWKFF